MIVSSAITGMVADRMGAIWRRSNACSTQRCRTKRCTPSGDLRADMSGWVMDRRPVIPDVRRPLQMNLRLPKPRWQFRLRTLLTLVTLIAVGLSVWTRYRRLRILAREHHNSTMAAGYTAVRAQGVNGNPVRLRIDRGSIERALPHWEQSIKHAQLRDHYLDVCERPWKMFLAASNVSRLAPLPNDDQQLPTWSNSQIAPHVAANGLTPLGHY